MGYKLHPLLIQSFVLKKNQKLYLEFNSFRKAIYEDLKFRIIQTAHRFNFSHNQEITIFSLS